MKTKHKKMIKNAREKLGDIRRELNGEFFPLSYLPENENINRVEYAVTAIGLAMAVLRDIE